VFGPETLNEAGIMRDEPRSSGSLRAGAGGFHDDEASANDSGADSGNRLHRGTVHIEEGEPPLAGRPIHTRSLFWTKLRTRRAEKVVSSGRKGFIRRALEVREIHTVLDVFRSFALLLALYVLKTVVVAALSAIGTWKGMPGRYQPKISEATIHDLDGISNVLILGWFSIDVATTLALQMLHNIKIVRERNKRKKQRTTERK
jgi:hypothetical protein